MIDSVPDGDDFMEAFHLDAEDLKPEKTSACISHCLCLVVAGHTLFLSKYSFVWKRESFKYHIHVISMNTSAEEQP